MDQKKTQGLSTPGAIVIVGVLIAAAIFFQGDMKYGSPAVVNQATAPVQVDEKLVKDLLKDLKVDQDEFETCMASDEIPARVQADFAEGATNGVQGTPYSLVVDTKTGMTIPVTGGQPFANFKLLVDAILEDDANLSEASIESGISTDVSEDYIRGNEDARIVVIEYSDIECPFCARFHTTMKEALEVYPDDVAWVYRHFPLDQIHPNARKAAAAVECIGEQQGSDAYWEALDRMFANPSLPKSL